MITNLFSAIPFAGEGIVTWLWGGFSVDNPTLNRFFSLHYLLPFVIVGVVILHLVALHRFGSNNPLGIDTRGPQDTIPFHPYYTIKDFFGLSVFLTFFAAAVFFFPNFMGHPDNYIPANALQTPAHIVPEWYFLPFYAILRAVPDKLGGVLAMFGAASRGRIFRQLRTQWRPGAAAGALSIVTYGLALSAFALGPTAPLAALRETGMVTALVIGVVALRERVDTRRVAAVLAILIGAALILRR